LVARALKYVGRLACTAKRKLTEVLNGSVQELSYKNAVTCRSGLKTTKSPLSKCFL